MALQRLPRVRAKIRNRCEPVIPKHLPATSVEGSTNRRRQTSTYDPEATHPPTPNQPKGEQKANRKPKLLETHLTPTKHSVAPRSNRKLLAHLHDRIRPVFVGEGRPSPPATAAVWPSPCVQNFRTAQPNLSRRQTFSHREALGSQALKIETTCRKTPGNGGKKAKGAPLIFVSGRKSIDPLFCSSCKEF